MTPMASSPADKRIVDGVDPAARCDTLVCHFHSKLMQKEPRVGGAWEWHQDYGYWYKNEFLFSRPDDLGDGRDHRSH